MFNGNWGKSSYRVPMTHISWVQSIVLKKTATVTFSAFCTLSTLSLKITVSSVKQISRSIIFIIHFLFRWQYFFNKVIFIIIDVQNNRKRQLTCWMATSTLQEKKSYTLALISICDLISVYIFVIYFKNLP